jgi:Sigma-54 interaction domain/FHA domain
MFQPNRALSERFASGPSSLLSRPPSQDVKHDFLVRLLECDEPCAWSSRHDLSGVNQILIGRGKSRRWSRTRINDKKSLIIEVPDSRMSRSHARLTSDLGCWILEDLGSKNRIFVNGCLRERVLLQDGDAIQLGRTFFLYRQGQGRGFVPDFDGVAFSSTCCELATFSPTYAEALASLARAATSATPILVHGPVGVGKQGIARATHELSGRSGPFVVASCRDLARDPDWLGEQVKRAHGGTLFLDEVGLLSHAVQTTLLGCVEQSILASLGGTKRSNVRFIAGTALELESKVANGKFRGDLHSRLSGVTIPVPPIAERREDLGLIVTKLLLSMGVASWSAVRFTTDAAGSLLLRDWPENLHSIERCLATAFFRCKNDVVRQDDVTAVER